MAANLEQYRSLPSEIIFLISSYGSQQPQLRERLSGLLGLLVHLESSGEAYWAGNLTAFNQSHVDRLAKAVAVVAGRKSDHFEGVREKASLKNLSGKNYQVNILEDDEGVLAEQVRDPQTNDLVQYSVFLDVNGTIVEFLTTKGELMVWLHPDLDQENLPNRGKRSDRDYIRYYANDSYQEVEQRHRPQADVSVTDLSRSPLQANGRPSLSRDRWLNVSRVDCETLIYIRTNSKGHKLVQAQISSKDEVMQLLAEQKQSAFLSSATAMVNVGLVSGILGLELRDLAVVSLVQQKLIEGEWQVVRVNHRGEKLDSAGACLVNLEVDEETGLWLQCPLNSSGKHILYSVEIASYDPQAHGAHYLLLSGKVISRETPIKSTRKM